MTKFGSVVLAVFLAVVLGAAGCKGTVSPPNSLPLPSDQPASMLKGVGLSPRSSSAADFTGFFQKAKEAGNVVMWAGNWNELNNANGGPAVVAGLAPRYVYTPVIAAQFFTQSTGKLLQPMDDAAKRLYKTSAVEFVRKYKLKYIGLGIEVNTLYEKFPDDFETFTQFFGEVYDAVKATSPETMVFTIFQLEKMKGLSGGLYGGTNDQQKAEWSLFDKFPKADMFAFTTYPGLIYKNPAEIPDDYYDEIKQHTGKPAAFTEIGWHSEASPAGWESSDEEQAAFAAKFFELSKNIKGRDGCLELPSRPADL